jgi:translation initiation factor IF-1
MVKNTSGGNKGKGMARKNINGAKQPSKLRVVAEEGELYASVIKILGGAICSVVGMDNVERHCHIRGKFRGGHRRDNMLKAGTLVLVGDWGFTSSKAGKAPECDLLEVYSDIEKERLKKSVTSVNWSFASVADSSKSTDEFNLDDDDDLFSKDTTQDEYAALMKAAITAESKGIKAAIAFDTADDGNVDIDDI